METYKKIKISKGVTRDEHRLIMEKKIGRKLTFNEVVHHKDGDKTNNSEDNLEILSRSKHTKMHLENGDIPRGELSEEGRLSIINSQSNVDEATARRIKFGSEKPKKLIEELGISKFTISRIRSNKSWKHLTK